MSESRIKPCPIPGYDDVNDEGGPVYFVALPERWLGQHAITKDEAVEVSQENGLQGVMLTFAVSLALAENFVLPGLEGKPETWDIPQLPLELITWVNFVVYGSFNDDFIVKKTYLLASLNGHLEKEELAIVGQALGDFS